MKNNAKPKQVTVVTQMSPAEGEKLSRISTQNGRSRSAHVAFILREYLKGVDENEAQQEK